MNDQLDSATLQITAIKRENGEVIDEHRVVVYGDECEVKGNNCIVYGDRCKVHGLTHKVYGNNTIYIESKHPEICRLRSGRDYDQSTADEKVIWGNYTCVRGNKCQVYGNNCQVYGDYCYVFGKNCRVYGKNCRIYHPSSITILSVERPRRVIGRQTRDPQESHETHESPPILGDVIERHHLSQLIGNEPLIIPISVSTKQKCVRLLDIAIDEKSTDDKEKCSVCFDNKKIIALVPCGHNSTCSECTRSIIDQNMTCPICRTRIENVVRLFT